MSDRLTTAAPTSSLKKSKRLRAFPTLICLIALLSTAVVLLGQAGRKPATNNEGGVLVNVVAKRTDNSTQPITSKQLSVYDNGTEQAIRNFTPDPSPARIVLLVDNSLTIRADVEKLEQAAREQVFVRQVHSPNAVRSQKNLRRTCHPGER